MLKGGRISSATDTMIACIALPDQNKTKIASYSPHPPVHLPHHSKFSIIPGPSRSTLPLHSNWRNFRHVGVNGTQSTSQTFFPMQNQRIRNTSSPHFKGNFHLNFIETAPKVKNQICDAPQPLTFQITTMAIQTPRKDWIPSFSVSGVFMQSAT